MEIFRTKEPYTQSPYTDEYGTFVSAFATVKDPRSGKVLLVIGLDQEASDWRAHLWRNRSGSAALVLGLILMLLTGWKTNIRAIALGRH